MRKVAMRKDQTIIDFITQRWS